MSGRSKALRPIASPLAAGDEPELCSFCTERPAGALGHPGFTEQVRSLPFSYRTLIRLACTFCGTSWVRRRINSKTYEWWCIAE